MTRRDEIIAELKRLGAVAEAMQARMVGYISLHSSAAMMGDHQEMQQRRDELHTLMDSLLDNGEAIFHLVRESQTLP